MWTRYRTVLSVLLAVPCLAGAEEPPSPRLHLFILSGQSNMERLDPDVSFTPAVRAAFSDDEIVVVKDAEGGQPIRRWYREWKPEVGQRPRDNGELYERLMDRVGAALKDRRPDTVTFVWMQGERDARMGHGNVYAASLRGLICQLERDLGREDIFVVIGRLSDHGKDDPERPDWNAVRAAQVAVAEEHPRRAWVDTDDLNGPDNNLHYTKEGYKRLGARFAETAVGLIREVLICGGGMEIDSNE